MKAGYLLLTGLIAGLSATAARATIYPYAEYHLGEAGSLSGAEQKPQDSSGSNRHFLSGQYGIGSATVSNSVSPAAIGSTASLDTTVAGDQYWSGGGTSFSTLPKNNFAFGIFARSAIGGQYAPIFSLGDNDRGFALMLGNKWGLSAYHSSSITGLDGNFAPDTWAHLAVIRSGGVTRFYVDGVDQGASFTTEPTHGSPFIARNFASEQGRYFDGLLDEARVVTFTEGETTGNILAALQAGAVPSALITVGNNTAYAKANLSPAETSVFRVGGAVQDFVRILDFDGLRIAGTAPQKHLIQIVKEGKLANGRYPLIAFSGTIGGQGLAGLELADIPGRITESLEINAANSTIDLVISGAEGVTWTGAASALWNKQDTNWVLGGTSTTTQFLDTDDVKFDDSSVATVNAITVEEGMAPASVTVDASENYSFSGAGITLNSGPLTKKGTGTLTLANAFTGTGPIAIQGGTLNVGDGGASGSVGTGPIALSGGQLVVNRNGDVSLPNSITGAGSIGKLGTGRLFLSGSTSYSGPVTLAVGQIGTARSNLFPNGVTIAAGASLDFRGLSPGNLPPTINGSGVNGEGAILNSESSLQLKGTLQLGSDASVGGGFGLKNMGTPTYYDPYPQSFPCYVSGNHKLTKVGSGTFSLYKTTVTVKDIVINEGSFLLDPFSTVNNTYPGTITINGGSLDFCNTVYIDSFTSPPSNSKPIILSGGQVAVNGGPYAQYTFSMPIQLNGPGGTLIAERYQGYMVASMPLPPSNLTVTGVVSGSGSLTIRGHGEVTLTKALAYTGDTTIVGQPASTTYHRGRLALAAPGLDDASTVSIAEGPRLYLAFNGTDTVRRLFLNGVQQQAGVYNSSHVSGRIIGTGSLTVTEGPVAPPYQLWATEQGIAGVGANVDSDGDGISNGMEFVLGGDPSGPNSDSNSLLPVITRSGTTLKFVYRRADASSANYAMQVQSSVNPSTDGWTTASSLFPDPNIVVENDGFGPGVDKVTVSIPMEGKTKLFARLLVEFP